MDADQVVFTVLAWKHLMDIKVNKYLVKMPKMIRNSSKVS